MRRNLLFRFVLGLGVLVVVAIATAFMVGRWAVVGSMARTGGQASVEGLGGEAVIELDARAVPVVRGASFADVCAGLGFVHAQERFFQMDLSRRYAAGRLSEVVGAATLEVDRAQRRLGFERVARGVVERMDPEMRGWFEAYARGVNAGLADLDARPIEYWALGAPPEPWRVEDSVLCAMAMHANLSLSAPFELMQMRLEEELPRDVVAFVMPEVGRFDQQVVAGGDSGGAVAAYPGVASMEAVRQIARKRERERNGEEPVRGSNAWVVSGARSAKGGALLANDMHLGLSVPSTWYRAQLVWGAEERRAVGVTLPGVPGVVVGATDDLAWGFTNVTGDFQDYVVIGEAEAGELPTRLEEIGVRGGEPERLAVRESAWGPVTEELEDGRMLALRWAALDEETVNLDVLRMVHAQSLEEGLDIGAGWWGPPQNMMVAGADGRVGWVMTGYLPQRVGFDGTVPVKWGDGVGWNGQVDGAVGGRGRVVEPAEGFIATANQRTLPVEVSARFGTLWSLGVRAGRITEVLHDGADFDERAMLALQLDSRVEVLDLYAELIEEMTRDATEDRLVRAREVAQQWDGYADVDDPSAGLLDWYRLRLQQELLGFLTGGLEYNWFMREEVVQRVLRDRRMLMLPEGERSWEAFMGRVLIETIEEMEANELWGARWGEMNRASIRHPLSRAAPALGRWLDMPDVPLAGHQYAVRVQTPGFGASQRLVVDPRRLEAGLFHMPGGQSGHPFSKHYRDGFEDWVEGSATPLLPGEVVDRFRLVPEE